MEQPYQNSSFNPWTNVYGLARSLVALATFLTLVTNDVDLLFYSSLSNGRTTETSGLYVINFFNLFHSNHELSKFIALVLLTLVIIGWRPMITGIFHVWISISFMQLCPYIDGGDQISQILSILFLPLTLLDTRKWHWGASSQNKVTENIYVQIFYRYFVIMIRLQIALVYLNAGTAKFGVNEWINGSAVWYWFKEPTVGYNTTIGYVLDPILKVPIVMAIITWGAMTFELMLAGALFMQKKYWQYLLISGIVFHGLILFIFGLGSFSTAMCGALILYLRPLERAFNFKKTSIASVFKIFGRQSNKSRATQTNFSNSLEKSSDVLVRP
jgi:antimicrobial peptide system SdpB family protein